MVSYLFELGYDLMISSEGNVPNSPGFEIPLVIYVEPDNNWLDK